MKTIKHECGTVGERNELIVRLYGEGKKYTYDDKLRDNGYVVIEYEDEEKVS